MLNILFNFIYFQVLCIQYKTINVIYISAVLTHYYNYLGQYINYSPYHSSGG